MFMKSYIVCQKFNDICAEMKDKKRTVNFYLNVHVTLILESLIIIFILGAIGYFLTTPDSGLDRLSGV